MVTSIRARLHRDDAGLTLIEVMVGAVVALIGFGLVATVLVTAQRQERITTNVSRGIDEIRHAMGRATDDIREAKTLTASGTDAIAWVDANFDGVAQDTENHTFAVRTVSGVQQLVRINNGVEERLATGFSSGVVAVSTTPSGAKLTLTVTMPGDENRAGVTLSTEVATRGNG